MSFEITDELIARQPAEAQAIIRIVLAKIEELETRLNKTSLNSSKPPSSEDPHANVPPRRSRNPNVDVAASRDMMNSNAR